jgi:hypothetical protein
MTKVLRITAKRAGFRRAGLAHPDTPVDHDIADFTDEQIAALKGETMLIVSEVEVKGKAAGKAADKPAGDSGGALKGLEREKAIVDAVRGLNPDNPKHFTQGGDPKVEVIEEVVGFSISGDERDGAWAAIQAEREAAAKEG